MCHFYSLSQPLMKFPNAHRDSWQQWRRYRIGPGEEGQVLRTRSSGAVESMTWGFRSSASAAGKPLIRGEIVAARAMTADAFRTQRCLVFADGFYVGNGAGAEQRYFYFRRPDSGPIAFAGIWTSYGREGRVPNESFAILTCPANGIVGNVHERMPVILGEGFHDAWRDNSYNDITALKHMLRPWSDRLLEGWEVRSDLANRSEFDYDMADPVGPKLRVTTKKPGRIFTLT